MIAYIDLFKKFFPKKIYFFFKKIYHILRFYNIFNPNYKSSDKIKFGDDNTRKYLKDKILHSKIFLEYGSGNTTILASKNNIKNFSVESDRNFYFYLKKMGLRNLYFYSLGYVSFYSYPLFESSIFKKYYSNKAKLYASEILNKLENESNHPDLILIDGRYRVLCMLFVYNFLKSKNLFKTCVILDDFKDREYYNVIKKFFNVTLIGRLGICYIKETNKDEKIDILIEKYSYDER